MTDDEKPPTDPAEVAQEEERRRQAKCRCVACLDRRDEAEALYGEQRDEERTDRAADCGPPPGKPSCGECWGCKVRGLAAAYTAEAEAHGRALAERDAARAEVQRLRARLQEAQELRAELSRLRLTEYQRSHLTHSLVCAARDAYDNVDAYAAVGVILASVFDPPPAKPTGKCGDGWRGTDDEGKVIAEVGTCRGCGSSLYREVK